MVVCGTMTGSDPEVKLEVYLLATVGVRVAHKLAHTRPNYTERACANVEEIVFFTAGDVRGRA